MSRVILHTKNSDKILECKTGDNLLSVLQKNDIFISAPCNGNGTCGKCKVTLIEKGKRHTVLSCQTVIYDDIEIEIENAQNGIIESDTDNYTDIDIQNGYGIACDLGTTTIALAMYDLKTGQHIATKQEWNNQSVYGADVISRIQYVIDNGIDLPKKTIINQINQLILDICIENNIDLKDITKIYISGNTTMQSILCNINPQSIATYPFKADCLFENFKYRNELFKNADMYLSQCVSGYIGGDITSGLCYIDTKLKNKTSFFIDIGTNGEMALIQNDKIYCCSVATGPTFEGAHIACGMSAIDGAINDIKYNDRLEFNTIGDKKAVGICGSAIIQLTAILLELGVITDTGRLCTLDDLETSVNIIIEPDDDDNGVVYLTQDKSIYFTALDVRKIQLAKASIIAGINSLLKIANISYDDIDNVYIAGGFGKYLDINSAITIGMLPIEFKNKTEYIGNASLNGTAKALLSKKYNDLIKEYRNKCNYIELSLDENFRNEYIEQMPFYNGREE